MFIRRVSFPVVLLLFMGGLGALLYLSPDMDEARGAMRDFLGMETPRNTESSPRAVPPTADRSASSSSVRSRSSTDLDSALGRAEDEAAGGLGTGSAHLSVFSEPSGATVLIDNDSIGVTPLNRHELRSGVYIITVQTDNHFPADTVAILRNDEAPVYSVDLSPRSGQAGGERPALADLPAESATENTGSQASGSSAASEANEGATQQQQTSPPEPETSTPSTGTLRFTSEPEGARVELDGELVGTTPLTLDAVAAGAHEVTFTRDGYDTSRAQVTLDPEEEREVEAALNQLTGQLRVLVQPWGSIYIDGQLYERNADVWFETSLPIGEHEIAGVHPALGRQTRTVTLDAGEQVSVTIDLRNPPPDDAQEDASDEETSADSNRQDDF